MENLLEMKIYLSGYLDETSAMGVMVLLPIAERIEEDLKYKNDTDLRKIVNDYEREIFGLRGLKKLKKYFIPIILENKKKYLKYLYSRDKLLGYIDKWYEEQEKNARELEQIVQEERRKEECRKKAKSIEIDLRTIEEYSKFKKQEYEPIILKEENHIWIRRTPIHFRADLEYLAEQNIDAVVYAQFLPDAIIGLPLRKLPKSL